MNRETSRQNTNKADIQKNIYYNADIHAQINYNEKALTALKRYTSIAQAGHLDILCIQ